jgi:cystathionine gamma-synthase/methionine-gamma-lyase
MDIRTRAVHVGDRKELPSQIPVTTPIFTAASYVPEKTEELDRIFAHELEGCSYARYGTPTATALEELLTSLESGGGSLACASGMAALEIALLTALAGRAKSVLLAEAVYGATINLVLRVFQPLGVAVHYVDIYDLAAFEEALEEFHAGCVVMETISNPTLRVGDIASIAGLCRAAGAALIVDNTFATPLLARPIELGANFTVHSLTKFLSGHGDVLGGVVISDAGHNEALHTLGRTYGPLLGPFEAYLSMRGIKTFPLRMERQCANAAAVAAWLESHPRVESLIYTGSPSHPDAGLIRRQFPDGLYGSMISFRLKDAQRAEVFAFLDRLDMILHATSLGDVHSMMLYPSISSHREMPPEMRARLGITDNLVRLSVGIEAVDDITADLAQALG